MPIMKNKIVWAVLIIAFLVLQYRLWIGEGGFTHLIQLNHKISQQKEHNAELDERNKRLEARVKEYRKGQDILEEQARSQLGMIKNDETFIQVIEDEEQK